jgi:7-cyano-7-deazaguanine synthase
MKKLLALSGGLDSTVLLYYLLQYSDRASDIGAIYFDCDTKNRIHEWAAVIKICFQLNVRHSMLKLAHSFEYSKCALLKKRGPIGEGDPMSSVMENNTLPNRNTIFAAYLASIAQEWDAQEVYLGVHARAFDADAGPNWGSAIGEALYVGSRRKVELMLPFNERNKADIMEMGRNLKVPFQLTRSCYSEDKIACGRCGACQGRLRAFLEAGYCDPLPYQQRNIL